MSRRYYQRTFIFFAACYSLAGCFSSKFSELEDGPPLSMPIDWRDIKEPTPKTELPHRFANQQSYEVFGERYYLNPKPVGDVTTGIASWYGRKFHGRKTASGERYDLFQYTAAHKTLPIPSYVRVTNLDNSLSVVVKVNDRGPFHEDRIIDLSYAAASKLGFADLGTAPVKLTLLATPTLAFADTEKQTIVTPNSSQTELKAANLVSTNFNDLSTPAAAISLDTADKPIFVQAGVFSSSDRALDFKAELEHKVQALITGQRLSINRPHMLVETIQKTAEKTAEPLSHYRVLIGPFKSTEAAKSLSAMLENAGFASLILE